MELLSRCKMLEFRQLGDDRGKLVAVEGETGVPFGIERIFYIYGSERGSARGGHANRNSQFVFVCLNGSVKVRATDGRDEKVYTLDDPTRGLYMPQMVWKDMYDFSPDCVLLVIASTRYDGGEYIRDFEKYKGEMGL